MNANDTAMNVRHYARRWLEASVTWQNCSSKYTHPTLHTLQEGDPRHTHTHRLQHHLTGVRHHHPCSPSSFQVKHLQRKRDDAVERRQAAEHAAREKELALTHLEASLGGTQGSSTLPASATASSVRGRVARIEYISVDAASQTTGDLLGDHDAAVRRVALADASSGMRRELQTAALESDRLQVQ